MDKVSCNGSQLKSALEDLMLSSHKVESTVLDAQNESATLFLTGRLSKNEKEKLVKKYRVKIKRYSSTHVRIISVDSKDSLVIRYQPDDIAAAMLKVSSLNPDTVLKMSALMTIFLLCAGYFLLIGELSAHGLSFLESEIVNYLSIHSLLFYICVIFLVPVFFFYCAAMAAACYKNVYQRISHSTCMEFVHISVWLLCYSTVFLSAVIHDRRIYILVAILCSSLLFFYKKIRTDDRSAVFGNWFFGSLLSIVLVSLALIAILSLKLPDFLGRPNVHKFYFALSVGFIFHMGIISFGVMQAKQSQLRQKKGRLLIALIVTIIGLPLPYFVIAPAFMLHLDFISFLKLGGYKQEFYVDKYLKDYPKIIHNLGYSESTETIAPWVALQTDKMMVLKKDKQSKQCYLFDKHPYYYVGPLKCK